MTTPLTNSALTTAKTCLRKYHINYNLRLSPTKQPDYFRLGGAYHLGQELTANGTDPDAAVRENYANPPDWVRDDPKALCSWYYECVTVLCLLKGHAWRWQDERLRPLHAELTFSIPIRNPETGAATPTYTLDGKIDLIVELPGGRKAVLEYKTTSEDIAPEADYWHRLKIDSQISTYYLAARELGHDISTVVYDVVRKPTIRPTMVPLTDEDGLKIVLDAQGTRVWRKDGKAPKQTAGEGETLQTREMTLDEWGAKLMADIYDRPEWYYARREIARLPDDIAEFQEELWQQQKLLRECELKGRWFRNTNACLGRSRCTYFDICTGPFDPATETPPGFTVRAERNPELTKEIDHVTE